MIYIDIPKYKLVTLKPLNRSSIIGFWKDKILNPERFDDNLIDCCDGSIIILHKSNNTDDFFVEFQCQLTAENGTVSFGLLENFLKFCVQNKSTIRIKRNGVEVPPSLGAVFSDLKNSKAFKVAKNLSENLK